MDRIDTLIVLIPALPLAATLITALLGAKVLKERSHWPALLAIAGSFLLSMVLLFEVRSHAGTGAEHHGPAVAGETSTHGTVGWERIVRLWNWTAIENAYQGLDVKLPHTSDGSTLVGAPGTQGFSLNLDIALRADALTSIMLAMVTFVASLVVIYAIGYMHHDPGYWRFFTYVSLFVFSMTMLVTSSNFLLLYVFWEAVGACSYLLIGFWFQKDSAAAAGMKAFLVNRIGDFGFALGVFLLWVTYGSLNFHDVLASDGAVQSVGILGQSRLAVPAADAYVGGAIGLAIALLLFVGACGKSAQFPLHVWLPDAMEGPTPVSALIHAATMVTAGVYMVTRCTPLFLAAPISYEVVAVIGGFTALMAAIIGVTQTDLKRVLAYSTVSQLGYMFLGLGVGTLAGISAGMFHLFTHAFFKGLLFLAAGSVMHAMGGVIDMRYFSGLRRKLPITHLTFLMGALALAGIFPFAGFWSKDAILGAVRERGQELAGTSATLYTTLFYVGMFAAALTAFYTFRAFALTFYNEERIPPEAGHHAHESPPVMWVPLAILSLFAVGVGAWFEYTHGFANLLGRTPSLAYAPLIPEHPHAFNMTVAAVSTLIAVGGAGLGMYLYIGDQREAAVLTRLAGPLYWLSHGKFFFDQIYNVLFVAPLKGLAVLSAWFDRRVVDGLVDLIGKTPLPIGALARTLQNGVVQFYALVMMLGMLILLVGTVVF